MFLLLVCFEMTPRWSWSRSRELGSRRSKHKNPGLRKERPCVQEGMRCEVRAGLRGWQRPDNTWKEDWARVSGWKPSKNFKQGAA